MLTTFSDNLPKVIDNIRDVIAHRSSALGAFQFLHVMLSWYELYFFVAHKRKKRNWEENDYYDSDEDTFLDRTGASKDQI